MAVELIRRGLPKPWSFAVTRDGRIFFVNDETRTTTWLHPVTAEPVCTGNVTLPDLPAGWERSVNSDGVPFYVDHNRKETTFIHPITQVSSIQHAPPKSVSQQSYLSSGPESNNSLYNTNGELRKSQKKKGQNIRSPIIKRDSRSVVTMEGWLYKLEGGALKQWRKRWFVLADFCLFVYKGPDEEKVLGSILLPSYKINPCTSEDKTSRKFAFKAEHHNMKTYYFAADSKESMAQWMNVMSLASIMQKSLSPSICGSGVNPKVSFSNDDEDSGFTSYKSRRYGSTQDPNSTLNSSFASDQLNFQYGSREMSRDNFSDSSRVTGRSSENEFLGSGDKYPGHYGSNLSRAYSASPRETEVPTKGRQALYANAPPKPKRTGQKDPYAIAPNERYDSARLDYAEEIYDEKSHKHGPKSPSCQNYGTSCPRLYNEQYNYTEQNKKYFGTEQHTKLVSDYVQHGKPVYSDSYYTRNNHKQPPEHKEPTLVRPHSADFLEHDSYTDPFNAPVIYRHKPSSRNKTNQPPRPKSSLEHYDPYRYGDEDTWTQQDKGYWRREQVSSPVPMHLHGENSLEEQCVGYYSSQNIPTDERRHKVNMHEHYRRNSDISTDDHRKQYTDMPLMNDSQNSKSNRIRDRPASTGCQLEESSVLIDDLDEPKPHQREVSMKRLLEWKQRMLQSPLARKYPQRTSGGQYEENSSVPPPRPPLPEEYQQRVLQELENHEAQLRLRETQYKEKTFEKPAITVTSAEIHPDRKQQKQSNDENDLMVEQYVSKNEGEKGQRNARSPLRSQEHRRPSSSLGCLNNSYSSDEEGSILQQKHYTSCSKPDSSGKNKLGVFRMSKEDPNMSDSEIHVRTPSRLKKLVHQSEGLTSRGKRLSISAGDLLGKTHEELVLLLIQLRRNQSCIAKKKQQCQIQLESEKYLNERESSREEHMKKCEEINYQMLELEKQYEMTQPLINLVDNMVKLGSLYGPERKTTSNFHVETAGEGISLPCMQLLELSKQLHNRQLTCKGGSTSKAFNEDSLEERLQQLYHLDRTLRDEFLNFSSLQQDREILETTLEGVRKKVSEFRDNAVDMGRLYKQQRMIEKELSKVIRLLMQSIQKLDHVIGENSSLEQEIVCLKQQIHQFLQRNMDVESTSQEKAEIEAELCRVEQIIEELASHRRNINSTIEKVKVESKHKVLASEVRASPTGVAGSVPLPIRKKHQSSYMETDLDTMECRDLSGHGIPAMEIDGNDIPLYANAGEISSPTQEFGPDGTLPSTSTQLVLEDDYNPQDINEADDRMKMFYGIIPKDKPSEIKTVRIVKRESERRNRVRDKKKVTYDDNSLVWVVEEPEIFLYEEDEVEEEVERLRQTLFLPGLYNRPTSLFTPQQEMALTAHERLFGPSSVFTNIEEGRLTGDRDMASDSLRPMRRPKRRHYTISGFSYNPLFKGGLRSCDDVDMERCLRTANTPDIVRSTIKKSDVFDDKIIDRELGLPQKINIPERYIENEPEQLSATERLKRSLKAETIRRMLSETTTYEDVSDRQEPSDMLKKKVDEEKKRRARLLALNHALAREVMERSKIVAANVSSPESPYSLP